MREHYRLLQEQNTELIEKVQFLKSSQCAKPHVTFSEPVAAPAKQLSGDEFEDQLLEQTTVISKQEIEIKNLKETIVLLEKTIEEDEHWIQHPTQLQ